MVSQRVKFRDSRFNGEKFWMLIYLMQIFVNLVI